MAQHGQGFDKARLHHLNPDFFTNTRSPKNRKLSAFVTDSERFFVVCRRFLASIAQMLFYFILCEPKGWSGKEMLLTFAIDQTEPSNIVLIVDSIYNETKAPVDILRKIVGWIFI